MCRFFCDVIPQRHNDSDNAFEPLKHDDTHLIIFTAAVYITAKVNTVYMCDKLTSPDIRPLVNDPYSKIFLSFLRYLKKINLSFQ